MGDSGRQRQEQRLFGSGESVEREGARSAADRRGRGQNRDPVARRGSAC